MCVCGSCCACAEAGCVALACCSKVSDVNIGKYVYMAVFIVSAFLAWLIRDFSAKTLAQLPAMLLCDGDNKCVGAEGVLRISLGLTLFFLVMFLTTAGTTKKTDWRNSWHNGWWLLKFPIWLTLCFTTLFFKSGIFQIYAEVARVGSALFLLLLIISIINVIYIWNDNLIENVSTQWPWLLLVASVSYIISIAGLVLMYIWFTPSIRCSLNIIFVCLCALQIFVITGISLLPSVSAGLMSSGLVSLYLVYQTWSAIMSAPFDEVCNNRPRFVHEFDLIVITSFILGVLAIAYSVFGTGMDMKTFTVSVDRGKSVDDSDDDDDVDYGYGFFHFVFAIGSMYVAMLLLGWDLSKTNQMWSIDEGWISTWVQIGASWLLTGLYIWSMIAPFFFADREFR